MANVVGLALTFFFFAYQTVFYLGAEKLGAWAPADVPFSDLLNTHFPWVMVLFMGFLPAVLEEMQFRAFAIPLLGKYLRSRPLALVLAAFIWGFLHSAYPNQPFFIRGVEVGLGGIVMGLIMLRFGILATLIWHYSVDAIYTAFLLVRSPNHYLMFSGVVAGGLMLAPMLVALVAYLRSGTFTEESTLTNASAGISRAPRKEVPRELETPLAYQPLSPSRVTLAGILIVVFVALAFLPVYRFGQGIKFQTTRPEAIRAADAFLVERQVNPASYHRVAWIQVNVDPLAVRYLLERRSTRESDTIYRRATRLVLWVVRCFRPLAKEEYAVYVDPTNGQVFGFRHLLDESAPGASLSPEAARALAEKFVTQEGYRLSDFDLQNSEAEKRQARQDYTLVYQAKASDPRNVGEAYYRLSVEIAGDQVVGFQRSFKLPEQWERERSTTRLTNVALQALSYGLLLALVAGGLILLVRQVRRGQVLWRQSGKAGAAIAVLMLLSSLNQLPSLDQLYQTSIPLATFRLFLGVYVLLVVLLAGLLGWLVAGLVLSLYPDAGRILRASARRIWRRDAVLAMLLTVAATVGAAGLMALVQNRWHALAPPELTLTPGAFDAAWPAAWFLSSALVMTLFAVATFGIVLHIIRSALARRAWWLWLAGVWVLVALGPGGAQSVAEYALGWGERLLLLLGGLALLYVFFRDNLLAYFAALFATSVREPLVALFSQPAAFFRWNGLALAVLVALVLAWMFLAVGEPQPPPQPPQAS
jgi:membrane protease YdiL (CAAX protease family)